MQSTHSILTGKRKHAAPEMRVTLDVMRALQTCRLAAGSQAVKAEKHAASMMLVTRSTDCTSAEHVKRPHRLSRLKTAAPAMPATM